MGYQFSSDNFRRNILRIIGTIKIPSQEQVKGYFHIIFIYWDPLVAKISVSYRIIFSLVSWDNLIVLVSQFPGLKTILNWDVETEKPLQESVRKTVFDISI